MKRFFILLMIIACTATHLYAQNEKVVLYLLATDAQNLSNKDPKSLDAFNSSVIGFWCGAQVALEEMDNFYTQLKVVVRDINGNDTLKLQQILNEFYYRKPDLIITAGPKLLFQMIALYAKTNQIPVVNPFSTDSRIVHENPYVYKVTCNDTVCPHVLTQKFAGVNYIFWGNVTSKSSRDAYTTYFTAHRIPFKSAHDNQSLLASLSRTKPNVIITNMTDQQAYASICSDLNLAGWTDEVTWILPEQLITQDEMDFRIFQNNNIYYFSNCFADVNSEAYKTFQFEYFQKYNAVPTLTSFAPQGYDITRYFVGQLCNSPKASRPPLSYHFQFKQAEGSGFENHGIRLIQFTHLQNKIITNYH